MFWPTHAVARMVGTHSPGCSGRGDTDRQTFVSELVEHVQHPVLATIVGSILDEVIGPDMIALLWP